MKYLKKPRIRIPKTKINQFCESHHIDKLALFGSVLTNQFHESSDVDVLVEFEQDHVPTFFGLVDMKDEFEKIVGRKVDLLTPKSLSHYFRNEVLEHSYLLYGKKRFHPA